MVSVPKLLIIAERGYCSDNMAWIERMEELRSLLSQFPWASLQIRNKHDLKDWQTVDKHLNRWLRQSESETQILLNGQHFPEITCARHFPEVEMHTSMKHPSSLQGASIHSHTALQTAENLGFDYVQYGAVFPTSKPVQPVGLAALQSISEASSLPVLAVGGISSLQKISACLAHGAYGVSIGSWILNSKHPGQRLQEIEQELYF